MKHNYSSELKICSKCKTEKPRTPEFFSKESKNKDGLNYLCKECKKEVDKKSRIEHKDTFDIYQKSPNFVYSQLKYQAKKRNIKFELTFDYYLENLAFKKCYICGSSNTKHWIDRKNNEYSIGYTVENSFPCCELCNKMKMALDYDVFIGHCKKICSINRD